MLDTFANRLLREPLVHFLAIGVAVFALFGLSDNRSVTPADKLIVITPQQVERLAEHFEAVWRRAPTEAERAALVEDLLREEVYYREALALGLDRGDTVIRRRLRQKMEFLSEGAAERLVAEEAELRAWFEANRERFMVPARVTFRQAFFGDAAAAEAALAAGSNPDISSQASLLPPLMEKAGETAVDGTFGTGFFEHISALPEGGWHGPVKSAYGAHLIWLVATDAATSPELAAIRALVEQEWRREKVDELREAQYRAFRERYEVVLPWEAAE
jgi:hypothetical protein